jgi:tetratricopeptide (TPR) repeat protein
VTNTHSVDLSEQRAHANSMEEADIDWDSTVCRLRQASAAMASQPFVQAHLLAACSSCLLQHADLSACIEGLDLSITTEMDALASGRPLPSTVRVIPASYVDTEGRDSLVRVRYNAVQPADLAAVMGSEALFAARCGLWSRAKTLLDRALEADSLSSRLRVGRAVVHVVTGDLDLAIEDCNIAIGVLDMTSKQEKGKAQRVAFELKVLRARLFGAIGAGRAHAELLTTVVQDMLGGSVADEPAALLPLVRCFVREDVAALHRVAFEEHRPPLPESTVSAARAALEACKAMYGSEAAPDDSFASFRDLLFPGGPERAEEEQSALSLIEQVQLTMGRHVPVEGVEPAIDLEVLMEAVAMLHRGELHGAMGLLEAMIVQSKPKVRCEILHQYDRCLLALASRALTLGRLDQAARSLRHAIGSEELVAAAVARPDSDNEVVVADAVTPLLSALSCAKQLTVHTPPRNKVSPAFYRTMGEMLLLQERMTEALDAMVMVRQSTDAYSLDAWSTLPIHERRGVAEMAHDAEEAVWCPVWTPRDGALTAAALDSLAVEQFNKGRPEQAIFLMSQAVAAQPLSWALRLHRAKVALDAHALSIALEDARLAVRWIKAECRRTPSGPPEHLTDALAEARSILSAMNSVVTGGREAGATVSPTKALTPSETVFKKRLAESTDRLKSPAPPMPTPLPSTRRVEPLSLSQVLPLELAPSTSGFLPRPDAVELLSSAPVMQSKSIFHESMLSTGSKQLRSTTYAPMAESQMYQPGSRPEGVSDEVWDAGTAWHSVCDPSNPVMLSIASLVRSAEPVGEEEEEDRAEPFLPPPAPLPSSAPHDAEAINRERLRRLVAKKPRG